MRRGKAISDMFRSTVWSGAATGTSCHVAFAPPRNASTSAAVKPTRAIQPMAVQKVNGYCFAAPSSTCMTSCAVKSVSSGVRMVAPGHGFLS